MSDTVYLAEAFDADGERTGTAVHATRDGAENEIANGQSFVEADRVEVTELTLYGGDLGPVSVVDHEYLEAVEALANYAFEDADIPVDDYRDSKRVLANRTGRDAPFVADLGGAD